MDKVWNNSVAANADLSTKQYLGVYLTSGKAAVCATAGMRIHGVLQNEPEANEIADVAVTGFAKVQFGGTVAADTLISVAADGQFIAASGGDDYYTCGISIDAGTDGSVGWAYLFGPGNQFKQSAQHTYTLPVFAMADIADGDVVTAVTPGYAGTIEKVYWIQGTPVTTASKASTLNLEIGTTDVTGGTIELTSAACTPLGTIIDGAAITAENTFTSTDTISLEASSTTTFVEGAGTVVIVCSQSM